jgi:hypothetical protein
MAEFKLGRIKFVWKNEWDSSTTYYVDDVVRYGGKTYICVVGHASNVNFYTDLTATKWNLVSDGQEWKNVWLGSTYYKVGDIVKWGSLIYICITGHTSQTYLEDDQSKWDTFAVASFDWKTEWAINTYYKLGDVVKYGGTVYRCNTSHSSAATITLGLEADQSKWDIVIQSFEYKATWSNASVRYKKNDVVKYGGGLWIAVLPHTSDAGTTFETDEDSGYWAQFVEGLEFEDTWSSATVYQPGDIVAYGGNQYIATANHTNSVPTALSSWDLFSTGFKYIGDYTDATDYKVGDIVRLNGYTYLSTGDHTSAAGNKPPSVTYWQRLNYGYKWQGTWADATSYELGDTVKYGDNSYVCVLTHLSDEITLQNRPDQDLDGSEWNLLAAGSSVATLTTDGDLVTYAGAGPARLPIGNEGDVLVIKDNNVTWDRWGDINNVYYVSPEGTDAASYGYTTDRAFKTVRYATEQVQKGIVRNNAARLIELNRGYIAEEIVETIYTANPALTNKETCRRDMGQVIDAIASDLRKGGNVSIREATLTYFSDATTLLPSIAGEIADTITGINHGLTVIKYILDNGAGAISYTTVGAITAQTISGIVAETAASAEATSLTGIITTTLTAVDTSTLPAIHRTQNTIFVKTGQYAEVLPIVVPKDTAVVGDELRSTRIAPSPVALVAAADTPYSLDGLSRLQAIISDIVTDPSTVVKTGGNSLNPVDMAPLIGTAAAGTFASELVQQISDYVDWGVNGATGDSTVPVTYGTNTPNTTTDYTYAIQSIEANREFLKAEVNAYIAATYPSYVYDAAKCARDIDRYIDAIKYDMIYTGNYKSLLYARYYVNAVNGSLQEDMFYLRNGTGLRNCTLTGLTGTLGAANAFGTKRPSAGSFVSLDPGYGTADTFAWITNKSPYVQNVSTFGTACIGMKVDGDLHDGGNDSIVANDFTQIISDGIGAWVTNLGRAELVSVFSYYGHIGYLAEAGGKIRATNGNSSYGTFGTVAEGVDITETEITGTVNNRVYEATIDLVQTNATKLLGLEYSNAGTNYTTENNVYIFTSGVGANVVGNEIRDKSVFEVRMLTAGADYGFAESYAQTGNATSITLSATDGAGSPDYVGMTVYIKAGKGVGQYGKIATYDSGTKIATVQDRYGNAGWNNIVLGTPAQSSLDLTSLYQVEPTIEFTSPTFTETATTLPTANVYKKPAAYGDTILAVGSTNSSISKSVDGGQTWSASTTATSGRGAIAAGNIGGTTYWVTIPYGPGGASSAGEYSTDAGTTWNSMTLPSANNWISVAYGDGVFMAIAQGGDVAISSNGNTWTGATSMAPSLSGANLLAVAYGAGKWVVASANAPTDPMQYSADNGTTWTVCTTPTGAYNDITFGNNLWVAVGTSGALAHSTDGITFTDNVNAAGTNTNFSVSYGQGLFVLSSYSGSVYEAYTSENGTTWTQRALTENSVDTNFVFIAHSTQGPTWVGVPEGNLVTGACYFPNITTARGRSRPTSAGEIAKIVILEPGSGYTSTPTMTIVDPANTVEATVTIRTGDGALAQPTFVARGTGFSTSTATVAGDGYKDQYQDGKFINVAALSAVPVAGSNVEFNLDGTIYKLVTVTELLGSGPYTARLQISPAMSIVNAPEHNDPLEMRIRYSQVRLTGHDFLDIGTGNFADTNYPGTPSNVPNQESEAKENGGGRVFYTSTDQDGNFRVGDLFSVEQATGSSTLNADAFNLAGLQELQLGSVALGSSNTSISEFSTDGTFAANSDNIVPTQKAIKTYLEGQIGGGGSSLNVNKLTAGTVEISSNVITSTGNIPIDINTKVKFKGGVDGTPLALNFFLLR